MVRGWFGAGCPIRSCGGSGMGQWRRSRLPPIASSRPGPVQWALASRSLSGELPAFNGDLVL
ncbi:hypothetical protein TNCT1_42090 [Streptomyces sp. 1-11]|nr:hypothetical protein TNCT1_42090 [Streptomyces sp. 1-11]